MHIEEKDLWGLFHGEIKGPKKDILTEHLNGCRFCKQKWEVLKQEEAMFQSFELPAPSESLTLNITEKIVRRRLRSERFWDRVFKFSIYSSIFLLITVIIWNLKMVNALSMMSPYKSYIWYTMPIIILMFLMGYKDRFKEKY